MFASLNLLKFSFLLCFNLNQCSVRERWRQSQSPSNVARDGGYHQFQWYEMSRNSLETLCRMNNRQRFQSLLDPILVPRIVGTQSHQEVAGHLARTLSALGFTIDWDQFTGLTPHGNKSFETLIATYDRDAPRRLVLACHYDSKILKGSVFIGATDSAVPCAMLLEMASTLSPLLANRRRKDVTLQLIFFDGEEALEEWSATDSIYGSRHLASKWKREYFASTSQSSFKIRNEIDRIDLLVLLDLLGVPNPVIQNFREYSSTSAFYKLVEIEEALREIGCLHQLRRIFYRQTVNGKVEDDHLPFLEYGVPILHVIPIPFPTVWHTAADNADVLHYETIDNFNSILRVFVAEYLGLLP